LGGKKFSSELLRNGEDTLVIKGKFEDTHKKVTLRRIYSSKGQSRTYINERVSTQKELINITSRLADLHGQHDHQNLLNPHTHIEYLDAFGSYQSEFEKLQNLFLSREKKTSQLALLRRKLKEYGEKKELHQFQIEELTKHPLSGKFEQEIIVRHNQLAHAKEIQSGLENTKQNLTGSGSSIISQYLTAVSNLKHIVHHDSAIEIIHSRLESQRIEIEDIIQDIESIANGIVSDDSELELLSSIIGDIESLKRKYGGTLDSVMNYRDELLKSTQESESYSAEIGRLEKDCDTINKQLLSAAKILTNLRIDAARSLEALIQKYLHHLNMPKTEINIQIMTDFESIHENGADIVEFYISTNVGEKLRPLSKIASGGEISRTMLAIKMALQSKDMVGTLIFDEVDSGISGETADRVGNTIEALSNSHQIICITHLSQIAGKGDSHYKVHKEMKNGRNISQIKLLSHSERIEEIASLISGKKISKMSKAKAKELLLENG
jgi:DNA repair protein RecN (Recombination protein N)